ncbi:MAG: hypothetical protein NT156_06890 [Mycobacterium sp.]|nr:hypothetical protein [Mycobacterium sp.]
MWSRSLRQVIAVSSERPTRATVEQVFGSTLPRTSSDERDVDVSAEDAERDRWLRENVPPHSV